MCGIAGIVRFDDHHVEAKEIQRLTDLIAHRGPDDAGLHLDGTVGLGHRRLSIVDLSPAGHQPMASADGQLWIVFNGEIYNHAALREELAGQGHRFRSTTDTEVILAAWQQWGDDCVNRFEGMWAFALWEPSRRRLFCSRDRLGIKPFYYALTTSGFVFGSEIKAVLGSGLIEVRADSAALRQQLVYRARTNNQGTCFHDVLQLPPAHNAVLQDGHFQMRQYWDASSFIQHKLHTAAADYAARFLEEIDQAVNSHLRSDVPVGACLSGGLDSGTLVTLAARRMASPLRTFSVTYPGTKFDESTWIHALTAQERNLAPVESSPDGRDMVEVLELATWHYEEPLFSQSVYSWWHVMKAVNAGGIKVVINGQGADELLGGYPRYYPSYLRQLLLSGRLQELRKNFNAFRAQQGNLSATTLVRDLATPFLPQWMRSGLRLAGRGQAYDDSFLAPEFRALKDHAAEALARRAFSNLDQHLLSDLTTTRLPELLQAEDRFSMAFSIESRVPFLDRRFVEFGLALPTNQKIDCGITKVVLRNAMRGRLPDITVDRRDKQGYPTPGETWLRQYGTDYAGDILSSRRFRERGVFDAKATASAFQRWREGKAPLAALWTWLSTEEWFRRYFDNPLA